VIAIHCSTQGHQAQETRDKREGHLRGNKWDRAEAGEREKNRLRGELSTNLTDLQGHVNDIRCVDDGDVI
jgi:hypothetical protein